MLTEQIRKGLGWDGQGVDFVLTAHFCDEQVA